LGDCGGHAVEVVGLEETGQEQHLELGDFLPEGLALAVAEVKGKNH